MFVQQKKTDTFLRSIGFKLFYLSINNFTASRRRRPKPITAAATFPNLSHRLSGSLGSFFMLCILQRLQNIFVNYIPSYSQLPPVINKASFSNYPFIYLIYSLLYNCKCVFISALHNMYLFKFSYFLLFYFFFCSNDCIFFITSRPAIRCIFFR